MQNEKLRRQFGMNGMRKVNLECAPDLVGRMTRVVYRRAVNDSHTVRDYFIEKQSS
jgi:hypothetical protein